MRLARTKDDVVTAANLAYGILFVAMLAVGSVMAFRIIPRIQEAAGGRKLFDGRVGGYGYEEARTLLNALTPEAAKTYLKMATQWDMIFPLLYGAVLCMAIQWATPATFPIPPGIMALTGLPAVICDLRENALVAAMLMGGPDRLTPELAARASFWTRWKWRLLAVAVGVLLMMLVMSFVWPAEPGAAS